MNELVQRGRDGRFFIDRRQRLDSLLIDEIILQELVRFLGDNFEKGGGGRLLDAGAGARPYLPVYNEYFASTVSFDIPHSPHDVGAVDVAASLQHLPFRDGVFDCVLCTEVLEHVPDPVLALKECRRVLKSGGKLFLSTPFFNPLHEIPHDYYRYTPFALKHMAESSGLRLNCVEQKGGEGAFALMYLQFLWIRIWLVLSRWCGKTLLHPRNPAVYLTVIAPQLIYLWAWKRRLQQRAPHAAEQLVYDKLSIVTLGYVTTLDKPATPTPAATERF